MGQKNVTLSIDEKIYEDYKGFCKKKKLLYLEVLETLWNKKWRMRNED